MKVLLVDDSPAVQSSFGDLLAAVPNVELVGCAEDMAGTLSLIETQGPDLIVLDVALSRGEHGMSVLKRVMCMHPGIQVICWSNVTWQAMRSDLLAAGAAAYFDKANEFLLARDWIAARAAAPTSASGQRY